MPLNVLLTRPNTHIEKHSFTPPIGLGILGRIAKNNGCTVKIVDCAFRGHSPEEFEAELRSFKADVVGIQFYSSDLKYLKQYLAICRKVNPGMITFAGGPGITGDPLKTFNEASDLDYGFIGEAENGFDNLLKKINAKDIRDLDQVENLVYRHHESVVVNHQVFPADFWKHGFPLWEQIDPNEYPMTPHGAFVKRSPVAQMQISRGCPYSCTYCASHTINGKKLRYRPLESVLSEIEYLTKEMGVKEIHISDDVFTMNKQYVMDFCDELLRRKIDITWTCPNGVRLDSLDRELLEKMHRAGCYVLSVGIESGNEHTLKAIKKSVTLETIREKAQLVRESGIQLVGFFIIGYPTETREDILHTIKFSKELPLDRANFSLFMPLPKTEIYNQMVESGEIEKVDMENYGTYAMASYGNKHVPAMELKKLQKKAFRDFYFRPRILWGIIRNLQGTGHFKELFRRFLAYGA